MRSPFGWCLALVGLLVVFFAAKAMFTARCRSRRWLAFLVAGMCLAAGCADQPSAPATVPHEHGSNWGTQHWDPDEEIQT